MPTVSTLNLETILEENVQSENSLSRVIDINKCVLESEISSRSDRTPRGIPAVDDVNTTKQGYPLPELTSINNSSKKRKSCDYFPTSIKNAMDGTSKSLVNPSIVRDKFSINQVKFNHK